MSVTMNADASVGGVVELDADDDSDAKWPHVQLVNNKAVCTHCGASYAFKLPLDAFAFGAITKEFLSEHKDCPVGEQGVVCTHCVEFGHREDACPMLNYEGDLDKWVNGPDTGLSSMTIFRKLSGRRGKYTEWGDHDYPPLDPSDFGRCHRLLHAIPGWRQRIVEMVDVPGWAGLVAAWDELEAMYLEALSTKDGTKMYDRMSEIRAAEQGR